MSKPCSSTQRVGPASPAGLAAAGGCTKLARTSQVAVPRSETGRSRISMLSPAPVATRSTRACRLPRPLSADEVGQRGEGRPNCSHRGCGTAADPAR